MHHLKPKSIYTFPIMSFPAFVESISDKTHCYLTLCTASHILLLDCILSLGPMKLFEAVAREFFFKCLLSHGYL